jgi:hypothetical protein
MLRLPAKPEQLPMPPTVIVDAVLDEIRLSLRDVSQIGWLENHSAIKLVFRGPRNYFVMVFDHRRASMEAFDKGIDAYREVFRHTPCLARFGRKTGQYIALVDLDDPESDIGKCGEPLTRGVIFAKAPVDRMLYRVVVNGTETALHLDTGLCFARRLPQDK